LVLYKSIEGGGELSYLFWAHFCTWVKTDIKRKKDLLPMDIATFQSVFIIEVVNGYYKSLAVKKREKETAFRNLESYLAKPPYYYTMGDIIKFPSPKGGLLLDQYTTAELEDWIRKKTTESENGKLPELLVMNGIAKNEPCFLLKNKMLSLCTRFLAEGRFLLKKAVPKQWTKSLLDYKKEPAMENDVEFEKFIKKLTEKICPDLATLLEDQKLLIVYQEMEQDKIEIPPSARIFENGKLLSYSFLLNMRRKELLADARLSIPFWYSMPLIGAIINFFKKLSAKKKSLKAAQEEEEEDLIEKESSKDLKAAVEEIEKILIPPGLTVDLYLEELESRWNKLLDRKARENLVEDVRYLVRNNLRRTLKIHKQFKPTQEQLRQLAYDIVTRNRTLSSLRDKDSLLIYVQLYMLKLLGGIK
jgi:hypothetical protein